MSSVLKALRQQQSQLIPPQQPIHLTATAPTANRSRSWWWLGLIAALVVGWGGTYWYFMGSAIPTDASEQASRPTQSPSQTTTAEPSLRIGQAQQVRVVELPSEPNVVAPQQTQPTTSTFQAAPEVAPDEAVDLNEVPADLLAAFEEAIAATGSNNTTAQPAQSVLPRIAELDGALQRRIPDFTYDGHQYSSRAQERFVELAGQRLRQGDYWQGIQVLTIAPNHVVLALGNEAFQQPALEDWTTRP
ncbi:general secretion pathway protein GspB [Pseudidiomarina sp.]|uniref:general secretion pathway protein GspB n=1 Tax=Pseudidiomarina sp. TaxID=2081707 RepID=UPI003A984322